MQHHSLMLLNFSSLLALSLLFGLVLICGNSRNPSSLWSLFEDIVDSDIYKSLLFVASATALCTWYASGADLSMLSLLMSHFETTTPLGEAITAASWLGVMAVAAMMIVATTPQLLRASIRAI